MCVCVGWGGGGGGGFFQHHWRMVNMIRFKKIFVDPDRPHGHCGHIVFFLSKVDHQEWEKKNSIITNQKPSIT